MQCCESPGYAGGLTAFDIFRIFLVTINSQKGAPVIPDLIRDLTVLDHEVRC